MHNCSRESSGTGNNGKKNDINLLGHCAEVFCTSSGSLIYCCTLCDVEEIVDEISFKNHLFNNHQDYISIGKRTQVLAPPKMNNNLDANQDNIDEEFVDESDDNDYEYKDNDDEYNNNDDEVHDNDDDDFSCKEIRISPIQNLLIDNENDEQNDINHWCDYKATVENTSAKPQTPSPNRMVKTEDIDDVDFKSIVEYEITPAVDLLPIADENDASSMDVVKRENAKDETKVEFELIELAPPSLMRGKGKPNRAGPRAKGDPKERRFKCTVCDFAFKEAYNLRQHMKRHETAQRFVCSQAECAKRFHTKTELDTHERRHRGEFPFMCALCGKRFITAGDLNQHTKRHLNIRPHKCDKCNKSFFDTCQLKHHYVVHTRERPHTCKTCLATFARRKSLVTHMKIHANKREYVCTICQAAFNQAPGLRMHLRNKHKDVISVQESLKQNEKLTLYSE